MKRVILLFGNPDNGKTFLAKQLKAKKAHCISVDAEYVKFVKTKYPRFFLKELGNCILQHYDYIFRLEGQRARDWHQHLWGKIQQAYAKHDTVVVEGYLLHDCKEGFAAALSQASVRTILVSAEGRAYVVETLRMTAEAFLKGLG